MNKVLDKLWRHLLLWICLFASMTAWATHQRAGEISYVYISGLTYEFTVVSYTYSLSPADRPEIEVNWGDGSVETIERTEQIQLGNNINKNTYVKRHTFSAAGTFHVTFEDPNRNAGIINIPSSVEIPFFIETILYVNPFLGGNSSPQLLNPPIDNGCTNVIYYHNPGAYDADGDSLSYSLINCRGFDGEDIPGYSLPYASNSISIDPITGDLVWDTPTMAGEYNVAILIQEWRHGVLIGSMVRDMQITIAACNNTPPDVYAQDTCVLAGTHLVIPIQVVDPTSTEVTLTATGEPLYVENSPAHFMPITDTVTYSVNFVWNTTCEHVKLNPYTVQFKAQDNGPQVSLVSFKTIHIQVVAPAPENLVAEPYRNEVHLSWKPDSCPNVVGYDIYRRNGSNPFTPDNCETGMPEDEGYQWIGSTNDWLDTTFVDDGSYLPLYHANEYCYRVVAFFEDGAESYVSEEACTQIWNDAPLITHADVVTTDTQSGTVKVRWIRPFEIDSTAFPSPYYYVLYRKNLDSLTQINATPWPASADTMEYLDHDLNTMELSYTYVVQILNSDTVVENSDPASTIFLSITPEDRRLNLSWQVRQPWNNVSYTVYRYDETLNEWDSIATTADLNYVDNGLENGRTYCYYVQAEGYYWVPDTIGPLYNRSQQHCEVPFDNQPPEMPTMEISTDCYAVYYRWNFSSDSAAMDAYRYYIYYKPTLEGSFTCVDSFDVVDNECYPLPCEYQFSNTDVIVGCFTMAVADTNGNRTELLDSVCVDIYECLDYHLPNVFTPNGDGINDLFEPFLPYHGVEQVDMRIYNRWGRMVFKTEDPAILWDGSDMDSHKVCSDGVYFYSCEVTVNTLSGPMSYPLHGSVTIVK